MEVTAISPASPPLIHPPKAPLQRPSISLLHPSSLVWSRLVFCNHGGEGEKKGKKKKKKREKKRREKALPLVNKPGMARAGEPNAKHVVPAWG